MSTPLNCSAKFRIQDEFIENVQYQELIGLLMYLSVVTRPDITFSISYLNQFDQKHTMEHWKAARMILRYLKSTMDLSLTYSGSDSTLKGYVEVN